MVAERQSSTAIPPAAPIRMEGKVRSPGGVAEGVAGGVTEGVAGGVAEGVVGVTVESMAGVTMGGMLGVIILLVGVIRYVMRVMLGGEDVIQVS